MKKNKYNKPCPFKANGITYIDYKNVKLLRRFISKHGKIVPKYYTGVSLKYQKQLAKAIKKARFMGLLSYTSKY
ncbi:MAG: 30S ribosomal protein S18 [Candidatus Gracilibacteria bacterium]|nr:30S ribosomal protein S18 [Candidatus Peregrinibacteria bacterium]HMR01346.1 30S ribosomal protein S18 [Candidatus Gracilibacteria bacterium]